MKDKNMDEKEKEIMV